MLVIFFLMIFIIKLVGTQKHNTLYIQSDVNVAFVCN